jgi:hypothetical protein
MTKLTVAFRNFANAPKNGIKVLVYGRCLLSSATVKQMTSTSESVAISFMITQNANRQA